MKPMAVFDPGSRQPRSSRDESPAFLAGEVTAGTVTAGTVAAGGVTAGGMAAGGATAGTVTAEVVTEAGEAAARSAAGHDVVLIVATGDEAMPVAVPGPGRVARLIGDPADPGDLEAAAEMAAELFGRGRRHGATSAPEARP